MSVKITGRFGHRANAGDMMGFLGVNKLPMEAMPEREIQGIRVYVKPSTSRPGQRQCKHRVMAICNCGQHVPTGRLHQHICKVSV